MANPSEMADCLNSNHHKLFSGAWFGWVISPDLLSWMFPVFCTEKSQAPNTKPALLLNNNQKVCWLTRGSISVEDANSLSFSRVGSCTLNFCGAFLLLTPLFSFLKGIFLLEEESPR